MRASSGRASLDASSNRHELLGSLPRKSHLLQTARTEVARHARALDLVQGANANLQDPFSFAFLCF